MKVSSDSKVVDDLRLCKSCVNMKRECSVKLGSFG